jgi:Cu(I)/Ag(I) efflux system membrane fusion protein
MKTNHKTPYIALGTLALGLFLGWVFFGGSNTAKTEVREEINEAHIHEADEVWTCSMHPQIRQPGPGQCPICGMDLILVAGTPVTDAGAELAVEDEVQMSLTAMQIANVQTVTVQKTEPTKKIYLAGRVEADERNVGEITARFAGRIEKLYVNFTGQEVKRGQALASVYSPALITAQKELFEAARFRETNPSFYEAAVNKLKLWDLSDRQIQNILESQEVRYNFNVLAPQSGTVVARNVSAGDYVQQGQSLFEVANLDQLWVVFDAYESDLPWIQEGDAISFTVQSLPSQIFTSEVTFIDPVISPQRRVAEVRTEVKNEQAASTVEKLKPQMFAQGVLESTLPGVENALVIPKTAVLWTGKRAVVYVKRPEFEQPTFAYREVVLGPEAGGYYLVSEGLEAGEEVVANGVFKVDAAAQLQGKVSMMNPKTETYGDLSPEFTQQVAAVLDSYLDLKNALVASDAEQAATAAKQTQTSLAAVDMMLVKGGAHQQWMTYFNTMQEALSTIETSAKLDAQRTAFAPLSKALYQSVREFGVTGLDAYYQYCPMADNNTGAYWISEIKEIRNPYFGDKMLTCGSVKETIN